ncbi:MAG: RloB family protein [Syntrophorhabdaceae bacterium]|nr:RloB family protein [Syntrophorhabdaceae bacterium]MDD5242937.1 RloB family protein [Syntrophorhabdaceae bacterium]
MGSDDLFHKRKAQNAEQHRRKIARRDSYERILIVCEGEKTEPNYFGWLRIKLGLNRANVVIADKRGGLDPKSLVEYGIEEYNKEKDFDRVYCVFDKDKHTTYQGALDKIRSVRLRGKAKIHAITSVPCFEFWLLLHFIYTTHPYSAPLDDSNCALVVSDLNQYIPGYEKGSEHFLSYIDVDKINDAIAHAKGIETFHETSGTDNPSTKVHHLVEYLMGLKR